MMKSSIMSSIHILHTILRNILIVVFILFIILFIGLKSGIVADKLIFGGYEVEELYIKLDKKLTLRASKVVIPKEKSSPSFSSIDTTLDTIKYLLTFFDFIHLKNIYFEDNKFDVLLVDDMLYLNSKDYTVSGNLEKHDSTLVADVSILHIKKDQIRLKGNFSYEIKKNILKCEGDFRAFGIDGRFVAKKKEDTIYFKIISNEFKDLTALVKRINPSSAIRSWLIDKVRAKKYTLNSLEGYIKVDSNGMNLIPNKTKAEATLSDVHVLFKKELKPIYAKELKIIYKNNDLLMKLNKANYQGKTLNYADVDLVNLNSKNKIIKIDLSLNTALDKKIEELLKTYNIDLSLKHEKARIDFKMDINLNKSKKDTVFAKVQLSKGDLYYKNIKLPIDEAQAIYDSKAKPKLEISTILNQGNVLIGKTSLSVKKGKLSYQGNKVTLDQVHLKDKWYDTLANGVIDIESKNANLMLDINEINVGEEKNTLLIENKQLPITLEYSKDFKVKLPFLSLSITDSKSGLAITIDKLSKIKPYIKKSNIPVDEGYLKILKKDNYNYTFEGEMQRSECFFYSNNQTCYAKFDAKGSVSKNDLDFYAFNKRVHYNKLKSRIDVKNIHIDLKRLLASNKSLSSKSNNKSDMKKSLVIVGKNSHIRYDKYKLLTDSYDIEILPNGDIKAIGSANGDIVKFSKHDNYFKLNALRIKDKILHPLIGFDGLKEGRYTFKKSGNPDKNMKGEIIIEGGVLKDFKAYNNTLAFMNAIPALATLSSPGFSEKGFIISNGVIQYSMQGDNVFFDSVYIKGDSATIVGKGKLNIKSKKLDFNLAIQTGREFGRLLDNVPLLGYILLGEDKSMTVGLTITGTLNKPLVKTSATKDILSLPLQIIKRTLETPQLLIDEGKRQDMQIDNQLY